MKILAQIEAKVGDFVAHLHLSPDTPLEIAEQIAVQFLQYFGKIKEQHLQAKQVADASIPPANANVEDPKPVE